MIITWVRFMLKFKTKYNLIAQRLQDYSKDRSLVTDVKSQPVSYNLRGSLTVMFIAVTKSNPPQLLKELKQEKPLNDKTFPVKNEPIT